MIEDKQHTFYVNNEEVTARFSNKSSDPLNHLYTIAFNYQINGKTKYGSISITDLVEDMWLANLGKNNIDQDIEIFTVNIFPTIVNLGSGLNKLDVIIHRDDNVYRKDGVIYFKTDITPEKTARNIVYPSGNPNQFQIRRKILEAAYASWLDNNIIMGGEIYKYIPATSTEINRNIKYLSDKGYITSAPVSGGTYHHLSITESGIDLVEDSGEFSRKFSIKIDQYIANNIGGDYIAPVINGSNNKVVIKSEIKESFNGIRKELEPLNDKNVLAAIDELEEAITQDIPDPTLVSKAWKKIKSLGTNINEKILKHPILAQLLANQLGLYIDPDKVM